MELRREAFDQLVAAAPAARYGMFQALLGQVATLTARVQELERGLGQHSQNSHGPPASAGAPPPPRSQRQASGKRPGGQPGPRGATLALAATPAALIAQHPARCGRCGADLLAVAPPQVARRRVVDRPPFALVVAEHPAATGGCPHGQQAPVAPLPGGIPPGVPSGPPVLGFGRYLRHEQLLPYLRIQETLADRGGAGPGVGTLHPAGVPAALARGPVETARKAALTAAHLVPAAETGRRVANRGVWVPVACTARLTHQAWQATRGRLATAASGILPHFRGCRRHDAGAASWAGCCQHGRCKAPRLRARTAVAAAPGPTWARAVHTLLRAMSRAVLRGRAAGLTSSPAARLATFGQRYQRLLHLGEAANPPPQRHPAGPTRGRRNQRKARTLRARLRAHADAVLACLVAWTVPFDTHQAERDRRLRTVQQQISGTCRDPASAAACGRRRSSSATLRKQGQALLPALTRTLRGQPPWPALAPE